MLNATKQAQPKVVDTSCQDVYQINRNRRATHYKIISNNSYKVQSAAQLPLNLGKVGILTTTTGGLVREIKLPQVCDPRGDLTFVEGGEHIPFQIARVYYIYNVPVDSERGGHAHKELEQVVFALSGSFRLVVDDGRHKTEYWLRDPRKGLYISRLVWREMDSFSQGAVCMVLASRRYDEADYYRSYDNFLNAVTKG